MKKQRTLRDLGFKKQPIKKNNCIPSEGRGRMFPHSNAKSIEDLHQEYQSRLIHPTPDAPPDTGIGGSGHDDVIEKGDSGFMSYMGEKWKEGYPR